MCARVRACACMRVEAGVGVSAYAFVQKFTTYHLVADTSILYLARRLCVVQFCLIWHLGAANGTR